MSKDFMDKMRGKQTLPPPNAFIISPQGTIHMEYIPHPPAPALLEETVGPEFTVLELPLTMNTPAGMLARLPHEADMAQMVIATGKVLLTTQSSNGPASIITGQDVFGVAILLLGDAKTKVGTDD